MDCLKKYPEIKDRESVEEDSYLIRKGWGRAGELTNNIYLEVSTLNETLFQAFRKIINRFKFSLIMYKIQVITYDRGVMIFSWKDFKTFENIQDLFRFHDHMRMASTEDDRAWLISPEGEIFKCGFIHETCFLTNPKLNEMIEEGEGIHDLISRGWAKVGYFNSYAYLQVNFLHNKILRAYQDILSDLKFRPKNNIEIILNGNTHIFLYQDFKKFESTEDLKNFNRFKRKASGAGRAWLVSRDGKIYPCGVDHEDCFHLKELRDTNQKFHQDSLVEDLLKKGFAKVGSFMEHGYAYLTGEEFNSAILKSYQQILSNLGFRDNMSVEVSIRNQYKSFTYKQFKKFDSIQDFNYYNQLPKPVSASPADRAWIVSPEGEVYSCGSQHSLCLSKNRRLFDSLGVHSEYDLISRGWAKVGYLELAMYLEMDYLTDTVFRVFKNLVYEVVEHRGSINRVDINLMLKQMSISYKDFIKAESAKDLDYLDKYRRFRVGSLPQSRNFLRNIDLDSMPYALREAFNILRLNDDKDTLSANQVVNIFQDHENLLEDSLGRTADDLIRDLNEFINETQRVKP